MLTFSFRLLPKGESLVLWENLILFLNKDFLVLSVNLHYYVGKSEGGPIRY